MHVAIVTARPPDGVGSFKSVVFNDADGLLRLVVDAEYVHEGYPEIALKALPRLW